jgi:hypothetical protein
LGTNVRNTIAYAAALLLAISLQIQAKVPGAPDVLVLGDSQLTFGAGVAFVDLFNDMAGSCGLDAGATVGVIGVRSSTLRAWTGRSGRSRSAICDVDPTWRVNAGAYGTLSQGENPYIQIGQGDQFQFCQSGLSPMEAVFADNYYRPKLLVLFLLGNDGRAIPRQHCPMCRQRWPTCPMTNPVFS